MSVLGTVTGTSNGTFPGDLTISGDLTVSGDTTLTVETEIQDNILVLNSGETGAGIDPVAFGGIEIERGTETNIRIGYEESDDQLKAGFLGELKVIARGDVGTKGYIPFGLAEGVSLEDATATDITDSDSDTLTDNTSVDKFMTESANLVWDNNLNELEVTGDILVTGDIAVTGTVDGIDIATDVAANTVHSASAGADHADVVLNSTHRSSDGTNHANVVLNDTHRASDGTDHANVVLNDTHRASDGTDHANVVLNDTHRASDGTDHANVVLNDTHRGSNGSDHSYLDQAVTLAATPTFAQLTVDNLRLNNNTFSSTSGDINLSSAGTGVGVGVASPDEALDVNGNAKFRGTGAVQVTSGTTGERPTPAASMFRWNSSNTELEVYDGTNWRGVILSAPV